MKWSLKLIAGLAFLCFVTGTGGLIYLYKTSASPIVQTVSLNSEKTFDSTGVSSVSVTSDMLDIQTVPADSDKISIRLIGDLPESKKKQLDDQRRNQESSAGGPGRFQKQLECRNRHPRAVSSGADVGVEQPDSH